jgi:Co/Zn/Cd efflux system component
VLQVPEAEFMGGFGVIALVANVTAVLVRINTAAGARMRAPCSYAVAMMQSAITAVFVAAELVWLTATPYPDLVGAAIIAGFFIHSAWELLQDARRDNVRADTSPARSAAIH